ncbi:MAG: hypothetical protein IKO46_11430 [Salinivirgaceae bacterium]|nr:hypothetical protein [Salinivirgaceae bacterium]
MKNLKKQDIVFLKLFTIYQIVELVICFIVNHFITLAYWPPVNNGEIIYLAFTTRHFMYGPGLFGPGLAIQYGLVILIWIICVLLDVKYLKIAKIALYCSIDMIIPLVIPISVFIVMPYVSGFAHYVCWLFCFALLVILSKVLFFKYYEKRFGPKTVQKNK